MKRLTKENVLYQEKVNELQVDGQIEQLLDEVEQNYDTSEFDLSKVEFDTCSVDVSNMNDDTIAYEMGVAAAAAA